MGFLSLEAITLLCYLLGVRFGEGYALFLVLTFGGDFDGVILVLLLFGLGTLSTIAGKSPLLPDVCLPVPKPIPTWAMFPEIPFLSRTSLPLMISLVSGVTTSYWFVRISISLWFGL